MPGKVAPDGENLTATNQRGENMTVKYVCNLCGDSTQEVKGIDFWSCGGPTSPEREPHTAEYNKHLCLDCIARVSNLVSSEKIEIQETTDYEGHQLKSQLLNHYARRSPTLFHQFDAFTGVEPGDPIVVPDDDGDSLFGEIMTQELMSGGPSVRVLITAGTDKAAAIRALQKLTDFVERDYHATVTKEEPACPW